MQDHDQQQSHPAQGLQIVVPGNLVGVHIPAAGFSRLFRHFRIPESASGVCSPSGGTGSLLGRVARPKLVKSENERNAAGRYASAEGIPFYPETFHRCHAVPGPLPAAGSPGSVGRRVENLD